MTGTADTYSVFTRHTKALIVAMASGAAFIGPFGVNIYLPTLPLVAKDLNMDAARIMISVTVYMIVQGLAPPLWGPLSDSFGRRPIVLINLVIASAASLGLAFTHAYWLLLVLRMVQAFGATSAVAICAGIISDIAQTHERGSYMGYYAFGLFFGPAVGPLIGGALSQHWGWHAPFFFLAAFIGLFALVYAAVMPETLRALVGNGDRRPSALYRQFLPVVRRTVPLGAPMENPFSHKLDLGLIEPWRVFLQIDIALAIIMYSFLNTGYYMALSSFSNLLQDVYALSQIQIGLSFISSGVGCMAGSLISGKLLDKMFIREVARTQGNYDIFRARLRLSLPFLLLFCAFTVGYGWSMSAVTHISGPIILQFFVGFFCMFSFTSFSALIVDLYTRKSASVMSSLNIGRSLMSAGGVAAVQPLINAIGAGWTFTLVGGVTAVLSIMIWLFLWVYGAQYVRARKAAAAAAN